MEGFKSCDGASVRRRRAGVSLVLPTLTGVEDEREREVCATIANNNVTVRLPRGDVEGEKGGVRRMDT